MPIKIVTICGSVQPGNNTAKALRLVLDEFARHPDVEIAPIFLDTLDLPLPGLKARSPADIERFQQKVKEATGVLLASPEYHGGISRSWLGSSPSIAMHPSFERRPRSLGVA